jgi:hypothetical protein
MLLEGQRVCHRGDVRAIKTRPGFVHSITADNVFGIPAGDRDPTVTAGYWLLLAPLSPGTRTLKIHGVVPAFNFETEVTYRIVPEPASLGMLCVVVGIALLWNWRRRAAC